MGGKSSKSKGPVVDDTPKEIVIELPTTEEWTIETHDADGNKFIKMKTRDDMITLDRNATVQAKFEDVDTDLKEQKKRRGSSMKRRKQITTGEANNAELKESIRQADAETLEIVKLNAEEKKRLSAEFDKNKISNSTSALKSIIVDRDTIEAAKQVDQNDVLATSSSLTEKNKAARQSIRENWQELNKSRQHYNKPALKRQKRMLRGLCQKRILTQHQWKKLLFPAHRSELGKAPCLQRKTS